MNNITLYRNGSPLFNLVERGKRSVESVAISRALLSDDTLINSNKDAVKHQLN